MAGSGESHEAAEGKAVPKPPHEQSCLCNAQAAQSAGGGKSGPSLVTVAGAVASGLGLLGFVTFAGGVVLWSRFKEMDLPAAHALGLVPKSELVSTGAEFLVPAVLIATIISILVVFGSALYEFCRTRRNPLDAGPPPDGKSKGPPIGRWLITPLVLLLGGFVFLAYYTGALPLGAIVVLALVGLLGAFAIAVSATLPTVVYSLVAFLAVGVFAIARTYELTSHDLKVLPMAYSRSQPGEATRVEVGYFVAETSDRIIFASLPESAKKIPGNPGSLEGPNELREFPRSETDDLEIGELAPPAKAARDAARFAYNLCQRLAALTPKPAPGEVNSASEPAKAAAPVCPPKQLEKLEMTAGMIPSTQAGT